MQIAFLGSRGIPARYSGFETFVEQVAVRLVERGHEVTVYNRIPFNPYREPSYKGVRLVHLPTLPTKSTDTIVHSTLSSLHSLLRTVDIVYYCGVGSSVLSMLPRLRGAKTLVNVDGADFERAKWSGFARWWLHKSESWAARLADAVIADNGTIKKRYESEYGIHAELIPYGANIVRDDPGSEALAQFDLRKNDYLLFVARLVPENAADLVIEAYRASGVTMPLVIVGDAPYGGPHLERVKALAAATPGVVMTGFVFGTAYQELSYHARAFVLPSAIDATRPVLLDQMGFGNCVIVRDTPGNLEVVQGTAMTFQHSDPERTLAEAMRRAAAEPDLAVSLGQAAQMRVEQHYDWDVITRKYEDLFERLVERRQR